MKLSILLLFLFINYSINAQVHALWAKSVGSTSNETPTAICADDNGNSYYSGHYNYTTNICSNDLPTVAIPLNGFERRNLIISKLDPNGVCEWVKVGIAKAMFLYEHQMPMINDMAFYDGVLYCSGTFVDTLDFGSHSMVRSTCLGQGNCTNSFLMAMDASSGDIIWTKLLNGGDYLRIQKIIPYADGLFLSGRYSGNINLNNISLNSPLNSGPSGFLLKIKHTGVCEWIKNIAVDKHNTIVDMVYDNQQSLYVAGAYQDSIFFPSDTLVNSQNTLYPLSNYFAKFDTTGNFVWANGGEINIGGKLLETRLCYGENDKLYFTSHFRDSIRLGTISFTAPNNYYRDVIVQMDTSGQFNWAKMTGNKSIFYPTYSASIASNPWGFVTFSDFEDSFLVGANSITSNGNTDNVLIQYDFDGNVLHHKNFGGGQYEISADIHAVGKYSYVLTGSQSNYSIDNLTVQNNQPSATQYSNDIVVLKIRDDNFISVDELDPSGASSLLIYPNPSNDITHVTWGKNIGRMVIRNIHGQVIQSSFPNKKDFAFKIMNPGVYFVTVSDDQSSETNRVVVIE